MSDTPKTVYPDVSDIIVRKAEGRPELVNLSFGEKIARMEQLRERLAPFKRRREVALRLASRKLASD